MFVKYFPFEDLNHSLYPLSRIKKGVISKFETQMPDKKYGINLTTKIQNLWFYYKSESTRDLIYNKLIKFKGIKE